MVQQRIEAVCLHHVPGQIGIDILGIVAGFQDQRLAVHVADTGETIYRRAFPQLHLFAYDGRGGSDLKIHQRAAGFLSHRGHLSGKGIAHASPVGRGIRHKRAAAPLADHQSLILQLADGLPDSVAADFQCAAQLCLAGQQVTHGQHTCGDITLDNAHQLGIERNVAVQRQVDIQKCVAFHDGFLSCARGACTDCTIHSVKRKELFRGNSSFFTLCGKMRRKNAASKGGAFPGTKKKENLKDW